jgi:hypothetical protein
LNCKNFFRDFTNSVVSGDEREFFFSGGSLTFAPNGPALPLSYAGVGARSVSEDWTSLAYAAGSDAKAIVARRFVVA